MQIAKLRPKHIYLSRLEQLEKCDDWRCIVPCTVPVVLLQPSCGCQCGHGFRLETGCPVLGTSTVIWEWYPLAWLLQIMAHSWLAVSARSCCLASKPQENSGCGEWLASVQTDKLACSSLLLLLLHRLAVHRVARQSSAHSYSRLCICVLLCICKIVHCQHLFIEINFSRVTDKT